VVVGEEVGEGRGRGRSERVKEWKDNAEAQSTQRVAEEEKRNPRPR